MGTLSSGAKQSLKTLPDTASGVVGLSTQARVFIQIVNRAYEVWKSGIEKT